MKLLLAIALFAWGSLLFAQSDLERLERSLRSIECEESAIENDSLNKTLDHYRGTIAPLHKRYLETRSELARIEAKFAAEEIPLFFALIPYSESKFHPDSRGYGTAGLWQFSKQSARNFGLTVTKKNDERLDVDRSTQAAIRYLKSLKKEFGSWYLADFAYAMGEGKLKSLIHRNGSKKLSVLLADPHFPPGAKAHFSKTLLLDARIHSSSPQDE